MPGAFFGVWNDLYWVGAFNGNLFPNVTGVLLWILGAVMFNKFYVPLAMMILGLSAGLFFRTLRFTTWVCVLGGFAAALNSNYFSNAAWGLATRALSLASVFLAMSALQSGLGSRSIIRSIILSVLAGLAIGMSISEGGDNGAIFSIFVAGFAFVQSMVREGNESPIQRITKGVVRVAVMAVFAAFLAAQTLNIFVTTSVKGIVGVQQEGMSPEQKWDWATQWSLPKAETLRVIIPGIFGYRLDTEKGGNYWGAVGQQPGWEVHHQGFPRHSGAGEYAGVLVVLVALWAVAFSFAKGRPLAPALSPGGSEGGRKTSGTQWNASLPGIPFSDTERKMIWYWSVAGFIALLLSWGRHAPFYQLLYALPYFSTIRNPMKFMHVVHLCLMVLFAYGLQGITRLYLDRALSTVGGITDRIKGWWSRAASIEKRWTLGMFGAVALSAVAFLIYSSAQNSVVNHLMQVGFGEPGLAKQIAKFSANEVGLFVLFFAASAGILLLIQSGIFAGKRAVWAALLLGTVLVADLCRANTPWIIYYNWRDKYASNPVLDVLRNKPYEQRVSIPPLQIPDRNFQLMQQVYQVEWTQHHFPFYGIQSLDIPQEPRMPADKAAYRGALGNNLTRLWELTGTRYLFGITGLADAMNAQLDAGKNRFRPVMAFEFYQSRDGIIGARTNANGPAMLMEFAGALPRAKLYANWQSGVADTNALATLGSPNFDPQETVLVAESIPAPAAPATNTTALKAEIASYAPKKLTIRTSAPGTPTVLLLNDKWDEGWSVTVDGKPTELLRANFIMQGVALPPGEHTVQFTFAPRSTIFFISLAAVLLGILLCGLLLIFREKPDQASVIRT